MYKYSLNSKKKFDCPNPECKAIGRFTKYLDNSTGLYLENGFGKCDREDSCGYHLQPKVEFIKDSESKFKVVAKDLFSSDSLNNDRYLETFHYLKNTLNKVYNPKNLGNNIFINSLIKRYGRDRVLKAYSMYNLGCGFNGSTLFPYYHLNSLKTAKIIHFKEDLHRNKDINPMWLHSAKSFTYHNQTSKNYEKVLNNCYPEETTDYQDFINHREDYSEDSVCEPFNFAVPLFGWDLLDLEENKNKQICLVESEKTAVICSIVFPDYVWLASGGKPYIQEYKFNYYSGRNWFILPDLSTEDNTLKYWVKCLDKIKTKYQMYDTFIDYMPEDNQTNDFNLNAKANGLDIADYILDYTLKCGKYDNYIDYMTAVLNGTYEVYKPLEVKTGHYKESTYEDYCIRNAKEGILIEDRPELNQITTAELKELQKKLIIEYQLTHAVNEPVIIEPVINKSDNDCDNDCDNVCDNKIPDHIRSNEEIEKLLIDPDDII